MKWEDQERSKNVEDRRGQGGGMGGGRPRIGGRGVGVPLPLVPNDLPGVGAGRAAAGLRRRSMRFFER
jgi:predicted metalloprotease